MPTFIASAVLPLIVNSPVFYLGPAAVSAVASGIGYAAVAGIGLAIQSLAPKPETPKPDDVQGNYKQATPNRIALYGQGKLGGPYLFRETKRANFYQVIVLSSRQLDSIQELWVDDYVVTLNANGFVQEQPISGEVAIFMRLGLPVQEAFTQLRTQFPTKWTEAHRGDGLAMLQTYMDGPGSDNFMERFPNGVNTLFRAVARGCKVFDPTAPSQNINTPSTWVWTDNLPCVILDYMRDKDGMRMPLSLISTPQALAGWQQAVTDARDLIPLKAGGTEPRYRLWGSYDYSERPGDVLKRFMAAGNARLKPTPDGGMHLEVGKWRTPTVTIDETAITGFQNLGRGKSVMETANVITAQFTSAPHDYQATDADPWIDDADVAERGEITSSVDFMCSPSHAQTRRLMKIEAKRANPAWVGTLLCNLRALPAFGERFIHVTYDAFGVDHDFEVLDFQFIFGEHSTLIGVSLQVQSISADAYTWNAATEEGTAPAIDKTQDDHTIPLVLGLAAVPTRKNVGSAVVPLAKISWTQPEADSLTVEVRGKKVSESAWQPVAVNKDETSTESFVLEDGQNYEFQARYRTGAGRPGPWTTSSTVTAIADPNAPAVVTGVAGTGGTGQVAISWTSPNSQNYQAANIYRSQTNNISTATLVRTEYGPASTADSWTNTGLAAGTYYFWIKSRNASGVESAAVATGAKTVT